MPQFNLTQTWVGYLQRSYQQIKLSLISRLPPEITDHTDSNVLILVLSYFAGIAEMLSLYIDRMAEEAFIGTARRYSSVVKLAKQYDYRVKAAVASSGVITLSIKDTSTEALVNATTPILIPQGTIFLNNNNLQYVLQEDVVIPVGSSIGYGNVEQYQSITSISLGTTSGIASEQFSLGQTYVQGSLTITIGSDIYQQVDSFGLSNSTNKVFIVDIDEASEAYVIFGDGINGVIPPTSTAVLGSYKTTAGILGNTPNNSITLWQGIVPSTGIPGTALRVNNEEYTSSGKNYEGIEDIRRNAPLSIRTLYRAVTYQDFIDLAMLAPGVGAATVRFCCGECIRIYIGPSSKGIASPSLMLSTFNYFQCKKLLGRCVKVLPAGISRVYFKANISANYGVSSLVAQSNLADTLEDKFGYNNSYPNRPIYLSDIIAAIDNTTGVDNLQVVEFWVEPYARPITNTNPLSWTRTILSGSTTKKDWKLVYNLALNQFNVYLDGVQQANATPSTLWADTYGIMEFTILPGAYTSGQTFEFTTYPYNQDVQLDDNSIPIVDVDFTNTPPTGFYTLNITSSNQSTSCNPQC